MEDSGMKGLLGFLFLLSPALLLAAWLWLTRLLWKGSRWFLGTTFANRAERVVLIVAIATIWLGASFWEAGGKKLYWDAKVRELCAQDGGVKVYETVTLPPEMFDKYANQNWILPSKDNATPSDEYYVETEEYYYRKAAPQIARTQHRIIRRSDRKVLGELIRYGRGGGDLPGPWHPSSFMCPDPANRNNKPFETSIFMRGSE
jgi:hypothetical protein